MQGDWPCPRVELTGRAQKREGSWKKVKRDGDSGRPHEEKEWRWFHVTPIYNVSQRIRV